MRGPEQLGWKVLGARQAIGRAAPKEPWVPPPKEPCWGIMLRQESQKCLLLTRAAAAGSSRQLG